MTLSYLYDDIWEYTMRVDINDNEVWKTEGNYTYTITFTFEDG